MTVDREDLIWTIEYALKRAPNYRAIRKDDDLNLKVVAKKVLEHMELCGYRWSHRAAKGQHGAVPPR